MKRIGIFALPIVAALAVQGCIFLPVENGDRDDPFFFNPDEVGSSADFVEVGHYQPNSYSPPASSRHCTVESEMRKVGSACWFFPVMRVY